MKVTLVFKNEICFDSKKFFFRRKNLWFFISEMPLIFESLLVLTLAYDNHENYVFRENFNEIQKKFIQFFKPLINVRSSKFLNINNWKLWNIFLLALKKYLKQSLSQLLLKYQILVDFENMLNKSMFKY